MRFNSHGTKRQDTHAKRLLERRLAESALGRIYLPPIVGGFCVLAALAILLASEGRLLQILTALLLVCVGGLLHLYGRALQVLLGDSRHKFTTASGNASGETERDMSVFISGIGGQLRAPAQAILGMAEMLGRGDLSKAQRDHVKVLLEAGKGLMTLLDDLIALNTPSETGETAAAKGCDPVQAARTVVRLLQPNVWEKQLRLSMSFSPHLPRVAADARLIRRVLLKLVSNAIRFTDRGQIELAIAPIEEAGQSMVRFTVTDSGPGIPEHRLAAIFQPHGKLDSNGASRGVGVGLAIVKRLIESAGGNLGVESEPGMGTSFRFTLPALEIPAATGDGRAVKPPTGLTLLAHLPDTAMRMAIIKALTPLGNQLVFAKSLAEAITMSARGNFVAVIACAAQADALATAPGQRAPVLALISASDDPPEGTSHHLRWPANEEAIYAALHKAIGYGMEREGADDSKVDVRSILNLEKSLGAKTLIDILQSYMTTSESLAKALTEATSNSDWARAGGIAWDLAGAASDLGLTSLAAAARVLAQNARGKVDRDLLNEEASSVISEHRRVRGALHKLYPGLSV